MESTERVFTTRPELHGTFGMVASTHWLASSAGMAVLERGGNAFDAAVAAGFVLQVVDPHLNGPGGDMPALVYSASNGRVQVVCGQGPAPAAAAPEHFRQLGLSLVPGSGLLPACVPGAVGAWLLMLAEFGTWRLRDVLEYAIGYAERGYPVIPGLSAEIAGVAETFRTEWPESAPVFLPGGDVPRPGSHLRNPDLAATYRRLVREAEAGSGGRDAELERARHAWYEGFVAEQIDRYSRGNEVYDGTGTAHRGLVSGDDLASWRPSVEQPKTVDYHGWRVYKAGPWSQAPVFLQQLSLLQGFDLRDLDPVGADFIHLVVECTDLAMADREAWYGDPRFADDVVDELLAPAYADDRRSLVGEQAARRLRPGSPGGRPPVLPAFGQPFAESAAGSAALRAGPVDGDTCHVDVADQWGNVVAATPSGGWLQSSPVVPGLGFPLGTRAQMFALDDGHPNVLAPGKRPRTTLSPVLASQSGESGDSWLAFGSPGGDQQDQWALTFFVRMAATGWDLQRVIDLPMFHSGGFPSSFYPRACHPGRVTLEDRVSPDVVAELRRRGHDVQVLPDWSLGRLTAVRAEPGALRAAANPRGMEEYAVGR